jgi:hypothetical protein
MAEVSGRKNFEKITGFSKAKRDSGTRNYGQADFSARQ